MKIILVSFLLLLLCFIPVSSATPTTAQFIPSSTILNVNDTFTTTIKISPGQIIDTVAIDLLRWNPNVLECLYVQQGNLFPNSLVWLGGNINNTAGKITLMVVSSTNAISTPGNLCNITFKAKHPGIAAISIEMLGVARNGSDIPKQILNNCQLTVEGIYIPPVNTSNATTNQTTPPVNDTTPIDNETYIPIENNTQNETIITPGNESIDNNNETALPQTQNYVPPMILIYIIIIIAVVSITAYAIVRHYRNKQENEEDEHDVDDMDDFITNNFGGGLDDETSG
jgi:hypothetical protein